MKRKIADISKQKTPEETPLFFCQGIDITLSYVIPSLCYESYKAEDHQNLFLIDKLPSLFQSFSCTDINQHISRFLQYYLCGSKQCICASYSFLLPEKYQPYNFNCDQKNKRLLVALTWYQSFPAKTLADFISKGFYLENYCPLKNSVLDRFLTAIAHHNIIPPLGRYWKSLTFSGKLAYYLHYHITYRSVDNSIAVLEEAVLHYAVTFLFIYFRSITQPDPKYNKLLIVACGLQQKLSTNRSIIEMIEIISPYCTSPHHKNQCALLSSLNPHYFSVTEYLLKHHICDLSNICYHAHSFPRLLYTVRQTRMLIEQKLNLQVDLIIMNVIRREDDTMDILKVLLEVKAAIPYSPVYNPLLKSMVQSRKDIASYLMQNLIFSRDIIEKCLERSLAYETPHFVHMKDILMKMVNDIPVLWSSPLGQRLLEEYVLREDIESLELCFKVKGIRVTKNLLLYSLQNSSRTTLDYLLEQELSKDIVSSFEVIEACLFQNMLRVAQTLLARGFQCNEIHRKLIESNNADFNLY